MFEFLEGGRTFGVIYGLVTGGACIAVAIPLLWWYLPDHRRSFFGPPIDPHCGLQLGYGIFAMAMGFTDIGCRAIPHGPLAFVHPVFFIMTILVVAGITPRLVALAARSTTATT
jgi:hypothetical protein